ncbi:MAG TPA: tyrosine decarboxylase MfnA [Candidatus Syntrophoarchaeum butanivorans]|uniref:Probable L-tyrosine/L-aspartate decarboxylase n=1 Tax=Candidatus Syntropharchaeum butanivorans TaxID=1839936 RepID=A0A7C0X3L3_9EURY|nr:MAG: tyrosine decarboxylase MfnA [Candidatus Syntrophoarchaeum sp. WYZ-LMO15]HDM36851.1 tyrosine decarboxylase MfnA [Candidatus Syntrophoarchaeum butanivorans]
MMEDGICFEDVLAELEELKRRDLGYTRILSSMCTHPHPIAKIAHNLFLEANLGDPGLFPGTKAIEEEVISMIAALLGDRDATGYITTGGTESNIQAIRAFRNASGKDGENIVVPASAHFSFDKIGDLLRVEVRKAPLDGEFRVDPAAVEDLIDDRTIGLVGIAGTTEYGQIDPIEDLAKIARENDLFLHVDAAFGGFVIPFLDSHPPFDLSVDGVSSITIDPHKMGMSTIPAGGILFKDKRLLELLSTPTPYLTSKAQFSLTGTRSGAAAAATYAVLRYLGFRGFKRVVDRCIRMTKMLKDGASSFGVVPPVEPVMNVLTLEVKDLRQVIRELERSGWKVSVTREGFMRLVIMPHLTEPILQEFLDDLKDATGN